MDSNTEEYIKRVDPDIHEALGETENFEEIVEAIRADADEIRTRLETEQGTCNMEYLSYMLSMQNKALNQIIEEVEELRPAIRFITSALLGNQEVETDEG
jgi:hypothetical protein